MPKLGKNLVSQDVSKLKTLPGPYTKAEANTTYSIGDTHGNAVVLIRYLYEAGIINISQEEYTRLIEIYAVDANSKRSLLTKEHCKEFQEILAKGFSAADVPEEVHLRCFGDMLADRGSNDELNLIVLNEFRKTLPNVRLTILMSNHDKSLVSNYLKGLLHPGQKLQLEVQPCPSLIRLKQLIDAKVLSYAEVEQMIQTAYLSSLKLVDYVRTEDGGIDIMAHAPITLNSIAKAMKNFLPPEKHLNIYESVDNVAQILDELNVVFQNGLTNPHSLIHKALTSNPSDRNPINEFLWTRLAELNNLEGKEKPKYTVRFRHGHDGNPGETKNNGVTYIGYNSVLGKASPQHWGQAEAALLTMSIMQDFTSEEQKKAFEDVMEDQTQPATIVSEQSNEEPIEEEVIAKEELPEQVVDPTDLFNFQCQATLRINHYINAKGSYTNTESGDKLWTSIASSRNILRGTLGWLPVDVPQVNLAKQLKTTINSMTADNLKDIWPELDAQLAKLVPNLTQSGTYVSLIGTIISDFEKSSMAAVIAPSDTNTSGFGV